jgi:hypothetical protein
MENMILVYTIYMRCTVEPKMQTDWKYYAKSSQNRAEIEQYQAKQTLNQNRH